MSRLYQEKHIVGLLSSADINAGVDSDSFNMSGYHHASIILTYGPSYAGANPSILKAYTGATVGVKTTALTFPYVYSSGAIKAASADIYSTETTSAALSIARATMVSRVLVLEISAALVKAGSTASQPWVTLELGAEADAGECSIIAVLYARFAYRNLTCLV